MVVRFGARQPLLWAVCLLIGASAAAGLTTSLEALVAWRAAQGALGAVLLVAGQAALFAMFPRDRQGLVQATFALSIVMGPTTVAPALQGWITDSLSWSWIFILNLPVGALGVLALLGGIEAAPNERRSARFDGIGLVLLAVAMACLVFVLQEGSRYGWFEEAEIIHLSIIGTAALVLFIGWEIRAQARGALIDLRVLHDALHLRLHRQLRGRVRPVR
jgi:MFS transporter, DHA2 family, multidrug resistance protein